MMSCCFACSQCGDVHLPLPPKFSQNHSFFPTHYNKLSLSYYYLSCLNYCFHYISLLLKNSQLLLIHQHCLSWLISWSTQQSSLLQLSVFSLVFKTQLFYTFNFYLLLIINFSPFSYIVFSPRMLLVLSFAFLNSPYQVQYKPPRH